jgi:transcriptional regulator with XRE-family HTH domain
MKLVFRWVRCVDHIATGIAMKKERFIKNLSLREVARRMKVSAAFVCDLEKGRRNWKQKTLDAYEKALKGAKR